MGCRGSCWGTGKKLAQTTGVTEVRAGRTLFIISPRAEGKECQCVISVGCNDAIAPGHWSANGQLARYQHGNGGLPWQGLLRDNARLEVGK